MPVVLVHLIYIHGFQGNDTTFQSFPKHLQERLETIIPQHLDIKIQSSLYPTYKSVKPISHATRNFLEWLSTQPPGPVILMGHSMGGLLAAEAATDVSNNPHRYPGNRPKRIVGVVAFDTPFLGMHPHVVVSGIASLLPKGKEDEEEKAKQSERALNQHPQVNIVDSGVTDDWEAFKRQINGTHMSNVGNAPYACSPRSLFAHSPHPSRESGVSSPSSYLSLSPLPSRSPSPSPSGSSSLVDRALTFVSAKPDDPLVRWLRKHADEPFTASKRWIVEHFQFGICMFDPSGLKQRYTNLVDWGTRGGLWVNYWTTTVPRAKRNLLLLNRSPLHHEPSSDTLDNNEALLANGILTPTSTTSSSSFDSSQHSYTTGHSFSSSTNSPSPPPYAELSKSELKAAHKEEKKHRKEEEKAKAKSAKQEEKEHKKSKTVRHFVVTPTGLGQVLGGLEKWENVPIAGVDDEVNAHTGLFIPTQNLDYDGLVERVAIKVLGWCERIPKADWERYGY
ncbi:hypothetical protein JR316_0009837 [Psilocybe cubensis]|uniref:Thioesterase domain-containing protein n=2 Tax=Psilocybe cubensis TaxID=181762 RepID=A0A8H7XLU0_PSICU|nr:hypothetical protein JR316_0009837 [Psilocybe cubensis]KAH9477613.1 hypothetical protein JR316_0009837 [Psilocybe cubensis]